MNILNLYFNHVFLHEALNFLMLSLTNTSYPFSSQCFPSPLGRHQLEAQSWLPSCGLPGAVPGDSPSIQSSSGSCSLPPSRTTEQPSALPFRELKVATLESDASVLNELLRTCQGLQIHFLSRRHIMESSELRNSLSFYLQSLKALGSKKEIAYLSWKRLFDLKGG